MDRLLLVSLKDCLLVLKQLVPSHAEQRVRSLTTPVRLTVAKNQSIYMNYGLENYFQK